MSEQWETKNVVRVGPNQVTTTPKEVIIEASHPVSDWEVLEFTVPAIHFEDKKYSLVYKGKAEAPYGVRYLLKPGPTPASRARSVSIITAPKRWLFRRAPKKELD